MLPIEQIERTVRQVQKGVSATTLVGLRLDFKLDSATAKETFVNLAEAAVCFANSAGGQLVVGIRDQPGGADALVGTRLDATLVRQRVHELTEPHLTVETTSIVVDGIDLLVISVPEGLEVFATTKGYASRRFGTHCRPMRPEEMVRLSEERRGVDWMARASERPGDAVDHDAMQTLRTLLLASDRSGAEQLARLGDQALLDELGLMIGDRLARAGEILLCGNADGIADELVIYQHRRTPSGEADAVGRWGSPLITAFSEAMRTIATRQSFTPLTLRSGVQLQIDDFPTAVVREALVNALAHGDHRYRESVRVIHSPDVLSINSPGPLVSGVTPANILTTGKPRFPLLARVLRRVGLAEDLGQGVDRMFREMIKSGRDVPVIREFGDRVEVSLLGGPPNKRITEFVSTLPADELDDTDTLLVVHILCDRRTVSAPQLADVIQRRPEEAQRVLLRLSTGAAELLEPTAATVSRRHPSYRLRSAALTALGPAVRYHRRRRGELESKVVSHVREYEYINNATIQRLFDVDVFQARDILRDLVDRALLIRTSTQTRGVAVRYGPGPAFPHRQGRR